MLEYLVRRVVHSVVVLAAVTIVVFVTIRLVPGDVVRVQLQDTPGVTDEDVEERLSELGLDEPILTQLGTFAGDVVRGDFGRSFVNERPVADVISERLLPTIELAFFAMAIAVVLGLAVGLVSALHPNSWLDQAMRLVSATGLSIPNFWLGLMLITYSSIYLGWIPPIVYRSPTEDLASNLQQMVLPAVALGTAAMASIARMLRSSYLDVEQSNFIRTIRARGASRTTVVRHALRNSLLPVLSIFGIRVGHVLGGTVILEAIFSIPGMGELIFNAVSSRDYPVIVGCVVVYGGMFILVNLVVDIAYALIDPRIRYG